MMNEEIWIRNWENLSEKELFYSALEKGSLVERGNLIADIDENVRPEYDYDALCFQTVPVLVNELCLEKILKVESKTDPFQGMVRKKMNGLPMRPLYLYYDEDTFLTLMEQQDIKELCDIYRIVILVGMEQFEDYFCQLDVIGPNLLLGDADGKLKQELELINCEKTTIFREMLNDIIRYYQENGAKIEKRILDGKAKICVLKDYYEPERFRSLYRDLQKSLEGSGASVEICEERGPVFWTHEIVNLYQYLPDIVFQINKSRDGRTYQGEELHLENLDALKNLVYINWIQDIHPAVLDTGYAASLMEKDFIFSLFDEKVLREYGFPDEKVIYRGIMPVSKEKFYLQDVSTGEHEKYDYDICFLGTIMTEEAAINFLYQSLEVYLTEPQIEKVCDVLLEMLGNMYDPCTQMYKMEAAELNACVDKLQEELECDDAARQNIYRVFRVVRYNSLRKLILQQLASQKKYRIILYGASDVGIEGIDFGGFIEDQGELSKAIQCSKILMQINPDATMNQRVIESLLSHTMVMVFKMKREDDMSSLEYYLNEYEGICYFGNKRELIEKCDYLLGNNEIREQIAEAGYQKARKRLDSDYIYQYLLRGVKEKIEMLQGKENV